MAKFTKQAIMNCLLELLSTKQLDKITVKDIIEDCGVNRQTFYYHFEDIPDLISQYIVSDLYCILLYDYFSHQFFPYKIPH